jgi:hypothetical protein
MLPPPPPTATKLGKTLIRAVTHLAFGLCGLCSLATQCQTRFLELILRPIAGLKFLALEFYNSLRRLGTEE